MLLLDVDAARTALADLTETDFTVPAHQLTFEAVTALLASGQTPTPLAVLCVLRRLGRVSSWPTPSASVGNFLHELVEAVPVPLGYAVARRAVLEAAARRRLHTAAVRLAQAAGTGAYDGLSELLSKESRAVFAAHQRVPLPAVTGVTG